MTPAPPDAGGPASPDRGQIADTVVAAATAVPGVTGLSGGRFGEVATYLPGRRVAGVRVNDDHGEVHIVVDLRRPVFRTAEAVRSAVESVLAKPVTVVVADVAVEDPTGSDATDATISTPDTTTTR